MELSLLHLFLDLCAKRHGEGYLAELCLGFLDWHEDVYIGGVESLNVFIQAESAVGINRKLREEEANTLQVGGRKSEDLIRFFDGSLCQHVLVEIARAVYDNVIGESAKLA